MILLLLISLLLIITWNHTRIIFVKISLNMHSTAWDEINNHCLIADNKVIRNNFFLVEQEFTISNVIVILRVLAALMWPFEPVVNSK